MNFNSYYQRAYKAAIEEYVQLKAPNCTPAQRYALYTKVERCGQSFYNKMPQLLEISQHCGTSESIKFLANETCYQVFHSINPQFANEKVSQVNQTAYEIMLSQWLYFASTHTKLYELLDHKDLHSRQEFAQTYVSRQYVYGESLHKYKDKFSAKFPVRKDAVVIDVGAGQGDAALWFYSEKAALVYSFESDPTAFDKLTYNLSQLGHDPKLASCCCLSNESTQLEEFTEPLFQGLAAAQALSLNSQNSTLTFDDWNQQHQVKPDLIKIYVGQNELAVLQGMQQTIKEYQPQLVINLSGAPSNLWEIPKLVLSLCPNHVLYFKKHAVDSAFFMYAIRDS